MTSPQPTHAASRRLRVAIDGPGGAGKSTIGRSVARMLGVPYLDTGLMYRAITLLAHRAGIPPWDADALARLAESTEFQLDADVLAINGQAAGLELRSAQVEADVSEVSSHPAVRAVLARRQREMAGQTVVMVGRDIGTVILPDAEVKLWVSASPEVRARRRTADQAGVESTGLAEVARRLAERDKLDAVKPVSPMIPAPDAVHIDTGALSVEEAVRAALDAIEQREGRMGAAPFLQT